MERGPARWRFHSGNIEAPMPAIRTLLVLFFVAAVACADELGTIDGKSQSGSLISLDDKQVVFKTNDGNVVKSPIAEVIRLDLRSPKERPRNYSEIHLIDDSVLYCQSVNFKGSEVTVQLISGQELKLPLGSIATVLKEAENDEVRKAFNALAAQGLKRDQAVLVIDGGVNSIEGTFGDADDKGEWIGFTKPGAEKKSYLLSKLRGMIFHREAPANLQPLCMVYDVDGNAIVANKAVIKDDRLIVTTTIPKLELSLDRANIAKFDYNMGKLTYVSDLTPIKVVQQSAVGLVVAFRKDVNLDGDAISLGSQIYKKGLSVHAHTELDYDLKGKYKRFQAVLGVDPNEGGESKAIVRIEVDGRVQYEKVITVEKTEELNVDVAKGKTLRIIVSSSNVLDLHDHVTIAIAKLTQ
jgi:hypothetical protein